jgi:hypothetical protein
MNPNQVDKSPHMQPLPVDKSTDLQDRKIVDRYMQIGCIRRYAGGYIGASIPNIDSLRDGQAVFILLDAEDSA